MLRELDIESFKAFGSRQRVPLAPITLVFGQNSAGKSSLIQLLLALTQTLRESRDLRTVFKPRGRLVDLGGYANFVHGHDRDRSIAVDVTFDLDLDHFDSEGTVWREMERLAHASGHQSAYRLGFTWRWDEHIRLDAIDVSAGEHAPLFRLGPDPLRADAYRVAHVHESHMALTRARDRYAASLPDHLARELVDCWIGRAMELRMRLRTFLPHVHRVLQGEEAWSILETGDLPWSARNSLDGIQLKSLDRFLPPPLAFGAQLADEFDRWIGGAIHLGADRGLFRRYYEVVGDLQAHSAGSGERLAERLHRAPCALGRVNYWLDRLQVPYELVCEATGRSELLSITLRQRDSGVDVPPSGVGYGLQRLLPVIVETMTAEEHLIFLEEPEANVHPGLQARIGDLLIEGALSRGNQLVIETHSEHLILRLLRRIRETTDERLPPDVRPLRPADLSVLHVARGADGAIVTPIEVTLDGEFAEEWPEGFFSERLEELL